VISAALWLYLLSCLRANGAAGDVNSSVRPVSLRRSAATLSALLPRWGAARRLAGPAATAHRGRGRLDRFGEVSEQPLFAHQEADGAHLHRCWLTVPHVTQFDEADITELEAFRRAQNEDAGRQGTRLTLMPFLMRRSWPRCRRCRSSTARCRPRRAPDHAAATTKRRRGGGHRQRPGRPSSARSSARACWRWRRSSARSRPAPATASSLPADLQGGCFSISSLGGIGGVQFTPISTPPRAAISVVSRASTKPVWDGAAFQPRLMLPLALSYDHRVIDGRRGGALHHPSGRAARRRAAGCCCGPRRPWMRRTIMI